MPQQSHPHFTAAALYTLVHRPSAIDPGVPGAHATAFGTVIPPHATAQAPQQEHTQLDGEITHKSTKPNKQTQEQSLHRQQKALQTLRQGRK